MSGFQSPETGLPADKVAVGFIVTQTILKMMDLRAKGDSQSYSNLVIFLDNFIVQYKDRQYDEELKRITPKDGRLPAPDDLLRVTMKLLQRANFMPIKTYDGQLIIDSEQESELKERDDDHAGHPA